MVCLQIVPDSGQCPAQFLPVASIAAVAETAQPVVTLSLRDDGACTDNLPALAPRVERRHKPESSDAVVEAIPLSLARLVAEREAPVPSMSKTTRALPFRSTSWPVCRSLSSGRASRSARKSVRKASVAVGVKLARKHESAEREGRFSRANKAMNGGAKGTSCS